MERLYEIYKNDGATRVLIGINVVHDHRCQLHVHPCYKVEYRFTDTNHRMYSKSSWREPFLSISSWCKDAFIANGYKPTGEFVDPLFLCECRKMYTHLYVLRLETDKWYVGITSNPERRFEQHKALEGAKWTTKHPMIAVESLEAFDGQLPECEAVYLENQKVYELCEKYGSDNVRGGDWNG